MSKTDQLTSLSGGAIKPETSGKGFYLAKSDSGSRPNLQN